MAIKINNVEVISNARVLQDITDIDLDMVELINTAIRDKNNALRIYDSAGLEIKTVFGASATPL